MIKIICFVLLNFIFLNFLISQDNNPQIIPNTANLPNTSEFNSIKERIFIGGNIGAWFGNPTYVNLSPLVGFKVTPKFSVGAGITYNYYRQVYQGVKISSSIYGGNAFARYLVFENLFLQAGWDRLSILNPFGFMPNERIWVDNILVGGGYQKAITNKGFFVAAIFYNINQTIYSPYQNPIIQIGVNFGL